MSGTPNTGRILRGTGQTLVATAFLINIVFHFVPHTEMKGPLVIIGLLTVLMTFGGLFLLWRGRQYAARVAAKDLPTEARARVLYLRPFRSDTTTVRYVFFSTARWFMNMATEEEQLREVLQPFGDLVAIGQPGERFPKPGATRLYTSNQEWKDVVTDQMLSARLIIIRAGVGEGLLWELTEAMKIVNPQRLLILVLAMKRKHYEDFRQTANTAFRVSLPSSDTLRRSFGKLSGFVTFSSDWKASFLRLRAPFFRLSPYKSYVPRFKFALRPVFKTFGLYWWAPSVSKFAVFSAVTLSVVGPIILIGFYFALAELWSHHENVSPNFSAPIPGSQKRPYKSAVEESEARFADRLANTPSWSAQLEKILRSVDLNTQGAVIKRSQKLEGFAREHARAGFRRLDDSALLAKLELDRKILAAADTASCAAFSRGRISQAQLNDVLGLLQVHDMELWFDLTFRAMKADIEGAPEHPVNEERLGQLMPSLLSALPERDSQKFRRVLADYNGASDEQVCWAERTVRDRIAELDIGQRLDWALALAR
jgi:hypothetical protein